MTQIIENKELLQSKLEKKLLKILKKLNILKIINKDFCISNNIKPFIVGGIIRDCFYNSLKDDNIDIDIVVLVPKNIQLYKNYINFLCNQCNYKIIELDNQNLVYRVVFNRFYIDFTYTTDLQKDYYRRDYTINSLYFDLFERKIIDFGTCFQDMINKKIKPVNFDNLVLDPIRMIRGIRIKHNFSLSFEKKTLDFIKKNLYRIRDTNLTRLNQELQKIFNLNKTFLVIKDLIKLKFFELYHLEIPNKNFLINLLKAFDVIYLVFKEIMEKEYGLFLKPKNYYIFILLCSYILKNSRDTDQNYLNTFFGENILKKSLKILNDWKKRQNHKFVIDSFKHKNNLQIFELMLINLILNISKIEDKSYLSTLQTLFKVCKYICEYKKDILSFKHYMQISNKNSYNEYIDYIMASLETF